MAHPGSSRSLLKTRNKSLSSRNEPWEEYFRKERRRDSPRIGSMIASMLQHAAKIFHFFSRVQGIGYCEKLTKRVYPWLGSALPAYPYAFLRTPGVNISFTGAWTESNHAIDPLTAIWQKQTRYPTQS